ncbi:MAG: hypothetical protein JXB08_02610 [Bacilli bacterium]|nr:hypothetical protein [Bacilli bacterium]MBN2876890.1 hypothetical protein [Bacilli bacterium]
MKKKLVTITTLLLMMFVLASCDFLSTINAYKGFYTDYTAYTETYNSATYYTVLTETDLTISDTTATGLEDVTSRVYVMLDQESPFLYVEQAINEDSKVSLYEDGEDIYVEYLIDGNVVTPTLPDSEYTANANGNIFNENFDYTQVENENKTGDHTYEMDVYLNQVINLDALSDFTSQLEVFGKDLTAFDNAMAHVIATFTAEDSVIDINVALTDYTITFEDETYVTLDLTNHTVLSIPADFEMPNVFADPYQFVAPSNILLARRVYEQGDSINYPALSGEGGWVQLYLNEDDNLFSLFGEVSNYTIALYDTTETAIDLTLGSTGAITYYAQITEAGTYYLYISPIADVQIDIMISDSSTGSDTTTATQTTQSTAE